MAPFCSRIFDVLFKTDVAPVIWKNYKEGSLDFPDVNHLLDVDSEKLLQETLPVLKECGGNLPKTVWRMTRGLVIRGLFWGTMQGLVMVIARPEAVRFVLKEMNAESPRLELILLAIVGPILFEGCCWLHGNDVLVAKFWTKLQGMLSALIVWKMQRVQDHHTGSAAAATTATSGTTNEVKNKPDPPAATPAPKAADAQMLISVEILGKANLVGFVFGWIPSSFVSLTVGSAYLMVLLDIVGLWTVLFVLCGIGVSFHRLITSRKYEAQAVVHAGGRLQCLREALANIRGVKYACWEGRYFHKLQEFRNKETRAIELWQQYKVLGSNLGRCLPVLAAVFALTTYLYWHDGAEPLTVELVFPVLAVLQGMRGAMVLIPINVVNMVVFVQTLQRLEKYLNLPEREEYRKLMNEGTTTTEACTMTDVEVKLQRQSTTKSGESAAQNKNSSDAKKETISSPAVAKKDEGTLVTSGVETTMVVALADASVTLPPQSKLIGVVGAVGSGKTVLLLTWLGEQCPTSGKIQFSTCNVGYCPQRAFVVTGTIEENVRMGRKHLSLTQIQEALIRARLLTSFADQGTADTRTSTSTATHPIVSPITKDDSAHSRETKNEPAQPQQELTLYTEIGQGGVTLSGGQQARLNLARAWAGEPDILVADDPLAAVDHTTGVAIFDNLRHYAKDGKLVFLAFNQAALLSQTDFVLQLDKGVLKTALPESSTATGPTDIELQEEVDVVPGTNIQQLEDGAAPDVTKTLGLARTKNKNSLPDLLDPSLIRDTSRVSKESDETVGTVVSLDGATSLNSTTRGSKTRTQIGEEQSSVLEKDEYSRKFLKEEQKNTGTGRKYIREYFLLFGTTNLLLMVFSWLATYGVLASSELALAEWLRKGNDRNLETFESTWFVLYFGCALAFAILSSCFGLLYYHGAARAGRALHDLSVIRVFGAPLLFFDEASSGKVYGPLSTDLSGVDVQFSTITEVWMQFCGLGVTILGLQIFVVPFTSIVIVVVALVYLKLCQLVLYGIRDTKRLASLALSPVVANVSEAIDGASLSRIMKLEKYFLDKHCDRMNTYLRCWYAAQEITIFSNLCCYFLSAIVAASLVLFLYNARESIPRPIIGLIVGYCFIMPFMFNLIAQFYFILSLGLMQCERVFRLQETPQEEPLAEFRRQHEKFMLTYAAKNHLQKGNAVATSSTTKQTSSGLADSKLTRRRSYQFSYSEQSGGPPVAITADSFEQRSPSKESTISQTAKNVLNVPSLLPRLDDHVAEDAEGTAVLAHKKQGTKKSAKIRFQNCSLRYSENFPLAISDFNLKITQGEHIGVCGPTGAGKSSLCAMLFRFANVETGTIRIGEYDTKHLPLYHLRRNLFMVPQKPFLMDGTVRENLDPFDEFLPEEIETAFSLVFVDVDLEDDELETATGNRTDEIVNPPVSTSTQSPTKAGAKKDSHTITLDTRIEAGGANLSAGEAQLIAFARMVLRKDEAQIVLLDEPSSNLDAATDQRITSLLRTTLRNHTVFLIAHRLATLTRCDKVLVMQNGRAAEFGTPQELLQSGGFFAQNFHDDTAAG